MFFKLTTAMKKVLKTIQTIFGSQPKVPDPIAWKFAVKKKNLITYTVHFTAFVASPWRLYTCAQFGDNAYNIAFQFDENPCIKCMGKPQAYGNKTDLPDETGNSTITYYAKAVDFVMEVIAYVTPDILKGKITYSMGKDSGFIFTKDTHFLIEIY